MRLKLFAFLVVFAAATFVSAAVPISSPWTAGETWKGGGSGSYYGEDRHTGISAFAIDFNRYPNGGTDPGFPIVAVLDGIVEFAGPKPYGWGNAVELNHGTVNGKVITSFYAHFIEIVVSLHERVSKGQVIGYCGMTGGTSTSEHLHFELREDGQSVEISNMDGYHWCDDASCDGHVLQSQNSNVIDLRKNADLNDRNPYGWPETPDEAFGDEASPAGALYEIGWYHAYDYTNLYNGDGTSKNCYRAIYSGSTWDAAIVYDALGGARQAYVVGWEKWQIWDQLDDNSVGCPRGGCDTTTDCDGPSGEGGPNSCLGMPITNSYRRIPGEEVWRQDFQKGNIVNGVIHCYPVCAPGWTSSGWNRQYSYLFADAYDRNGAMRDVGSARGTVQTLSGNILIQKFLGGNDTPDNDTGWVMYDKENWDGNDCATNEAYWVYGDIKDYYLAHGGAGTFGCATTDRFQDSYDRWCQDFLSRSGDEIRRWRIFEDGGDPFALDPCVPGEYQGASGGPGDGFADVATLYDYGNHHSRLHAFLSTGSDFTYQGDNGWWKTPTGGEYEVDHVKFVLSGDYDGDGLSDVATLFDYGSHHTRIHVFLSTGGSFEYQGDNGWWKTPDGGQYDLIHVPFACSGDFNNDGKDDIATLFDYGSHHTRIHVFLSTGSAFTYQGDNGWWKTPTGGQYEASLVASMMCGDFNGDDKDDIATFFDYGSHHSRIHVFLSTGSAFTYQGDNGWWKTPDGGQYEVDHIVAATSGDFDDDGDDDIATVFNYGSGVTKLHVFLSTGSAFTYQGDNGWWHSSSGTYFGENVRYAGCADFTGDSRDDIVLSYRYSSSETRFHMFSSTGSSFAFNGQSAGWWGSTSYSSDDVHGLVVGYFNPNLFAAGKAIACDGNGEEVQPALPAAFTLNQNYPNPFNPITTISYSLPEATHVELCVYNILGQKVTTLVNADQPAGQYEVVWNAGKHASGIYLYRISTASAVETKKMLLLK